VLRRDRPTSGRSIPVGLTPGPRLTTQIGNPRRKLCLRFGLSLACLLATLKRNTVNGVCSNACEVRTRKLYVAVNEGVKVFARSSPGSRMQNLSGEGIAPRESRMHTRASEWRGRMDRRQRVHVRGFAAGLHCAPVPYQNPLYTGQPSPSATNRASPQLQGISSRPQPVVREGRGGVERARARARVCVCVCVEHPSGRFDAATSPRWLLDARLG